MWIDSTSNIVTEKYQEEKSKKKKIIIIIIIIALILIGAIVGFVCLFKKKGNNKKVTLDCDNQTDSVECIQNDPKNDPEKETEKEPEKETGNDPNKEPEKEPKENNIVVDINRKLYEALIYEDSMIKKQNIVFNPNPSSSRLLNEMNSETIFKSKYMLYIYEENTDSEGLKTYNAYAILLSMKKNDNEDLGVDIRKDVQSNKLLPMVKVKFNENGIILNVEIPNDSDDTLISYLYEFLEKVIPEITKQSFELVNENLTREFVKNNDDSVDLNIVKNSSFASLEDSNEKRDFKVHIKEGKIETVFMNKQSIIKNNKFNQYYDNSNFTADINGDISRVVTSSIKQYTEEVESELFLSSKETYFDSTLSQKILSLIENLKFQEYIQISRNINKKRKNDSLRNLDTHILDPYYQPIIFSYPLFQANFLGAKLALFAKIIFSPTLGLFSFELNFNRDGEVINIMTDEKYTNFNEILDNIDEIIDEASNIIITDIIMKINSTYSQIQSEINAQLNKLYVNIDIIQDFSNVMVDSYQELFDEVVKRSVIASDGIYDSSQKCKNTLNTVIEKIDNGEMSYIKSIEDISGSAIESFLNNINNTATNFYTALENFFPDITFHINYQIEKMKEEYKEELDFDINTFYDIKDILENIYDIYSNFVNSVNEAISNENFTYYTFVNSEFDRVIDQYLKKVEFIGDRMKNNLTLIKGFELYYQDAETGTLKREENIEFIHGLRNQINRMIQQIFEKINAVYNETINGENSVFVSLFKKFEDQLEEIKKNGSDLIDLMRTQVKFDQNYSVYLEDIKSLYEVYNKVYENKTKSYTKNIHDKLLSVGSDYLDEKKNAIKNMLENPIYKATEFIKELHYQEARDEIHYLLDENEGLFQVILKQYLDEDIKDIVISKYSNYTFLKNILDQYYNETIEAYYHFNYTFLDKTYKEHIDSYIVRPNEIETKLRQIKVSQEFEGEELFERITLLIIYHINKTIKESYQAVYDTWIELINNVFYIEAPKDLYGYSGNAKSDYEGIEKEIEEAKKFLYNSIGQNKENFKRTKRDQFGIEDIINNYEYDISSNLGKIINEFRIFFNNHLCIANEKICENGEPQNILSPIQQYQFQVAKVRDSVSDLKSLISYSRNMIGEDTLKALNSDEFLELYKDISKNKIDEFLNEINVYLEEINEVTKKLLDNAIATIQGEFLETFNKNINLQGIKEMIEKVAREIFVDSEPFKRELMSFMNMPSGPFARVKQIFNEELDYYKNLYKFEFDAKSYNDYYENMKKEMEAIKEFEVENFLNGIETPKGLKDDLGEKIDRFINEVYNDLIGQIDNNTYNFTFLSSEYKLDDMVSAILEAERNNLKEEIRIVIDSIYDYYLENLVIILKDSISSKYSDIIAYFDAEFNSSFTSLSNNSIISAPNKIDKLDNATYETSINIINDFFKKMKEIYNEQSIMQELGNSQDIVFEKFDPQKTYSGLMDSLDSKISKFSSIADARFTQEKIEFSSNIDSIIVKLYNESLKEFLEGVGNDYIKDVYDYDNVNNVEPQFKFLNQVIEDSNVYMNSLLNTSDLKYISKSLASRLKNIFNQLSDKLNEIIPPKVDNVINQKLTMFTENAEYLIPSFFITSMLDKINSDNLREPLNNEVVYKLIPKNFTDGFKANLTTIFSSRLNVDNYKEEYKNSITSKLVEITNKLGVYDKKMKVTVGTIPQTIKDKYMSLTIKDYENLESVVNNYKETLVIELDDNKKNYTTDFFLNEIKPCIVNVSDTFIREKKEQDKEITNYIKNFEATNALAQVQSDVNSSNITQVVNSVQKVINDTLDKLVTYISNNFTETGNKLKAQFSTPLTGFSLKDRLTRRRNLDEERTYKIKEITGLIDDIKKEYYKFRDNILDNKNFILISTKMGSLNYKINSDTKHLNEYFYTYKHLISDYVDATVAIEKIESEGNKIKTYLETWVQNSTGNLSKTIDIIKSRVRIETWEKIKSGIDNSITKSFDSIFATAFSKLVTLNNNNVLLSSKNIPFDSIYIYNDKDETILTIDVFLNSIDFYYSYYFQKVNTYDFNVLFNTSSNIEVSFNITAGDYKNQLSNIPFTSTFSINPIYYLNDKSVDALINVKSNTTTYDSRMTKFYDNIKEFVDEHVTKVTLPEFAVQWTKYFRNLQ